MVLYSKFLQDSVAMELKDKAEALGIDFRVQQTFKEEGSDYLVRIKKKEATSEVMKEFTDICFETIVPKYANMVRFSYPKKF